MSFFPLQAQHSPRIVKVKCAIHPGDVLYDGVLGQVQDPEEAALQRLFRVLRRGLAPEGQDVLRRAQIRSLLIDQSERTLKRSKYATCPWLKSGKVRGRKSLENTYTSHRQYEKHQKSRAPKSVLVLTHKTSKPSNIS